MFAGLGEGFVGINFRTSSSHSYRIHTIAGFYRIGFFNRNITDIILNQQHIIDAEYNTTYNFNFFKEIEAGIILRKWLRFSAGYGEMKIKKYSPYYNTYRYYTFTTGIYINLGDIKWNFLATLGGPSNIKKIQYRFSSSLCLQLDFFKIKRIS